MHDSFRGYPAAWWDFMKGCPNKVMDSHIYQAWNR
jgi:glucan 1,3-beta-glucosidase